TKKKALYRDINIPESLFYYILISRTKSDRHPFFSSDREWCESRVEDKNFRKATGASIRNVMATRLQQLEESVDDLKRDEKNHTENEAELKELSKFLSRHGISHWGN